MPESLASPARRWVAITIASAAAIWLSYAGVKRAWAAHDGASADPADWLRAAEMEPANADNWYRLGRYRQLDFDNADIPLAISYYRRAVQLDPRSPFYKLDLASALEISGNDAEADQYFRAAQAGYPISAEVSWRYGNFLLRQLRLPDAYAELHRAVLVDPSLIPQVISLAWHSNPDVDALLSQVLPNTPTADLQALTFFVQSGDGTAGLAVWNHLAAQKSFMDWKKSFPLIDVLLNQGEFEEAGSLWRQALAVAGISAPEGSLIFDGGFEGDIAGGGFGWRQEDVPGADFDFDTGEKHSGTRSARIVFDGTQNLAYENMYQEVLVRPATRYHFRGFLRTDQISTNSGIRFEIRVPHSQELDVVTPNETGTVPWMLEEMDFTTGPQTHLIQVVVRRLPSERLDNKLSGTVWVDDVDIVPVESSR